MAAPEFRVLGPLEVRRNGESVSVTAPKQRALLSLLLLRANEPVPQDELIEQLWNGNAPRTARASLQNQIHALREILGPSVLERQPAGYVLHVEPGRLDLDRFARLLAEARRRGPRERAAKLREALACWGGPPLVELRTEPLARLEISRLEEERLTALEDRIDADLELGRHAELVPELEALVARHPLRERFWAQLMLALYRAGRQADALASYRRAHETFVAKLGIEPGVVLRELQRAILVQDPAIEDPERGVASTLERAAAILPRQARERAESLYEYGVALNQLGERRQATSALHAAERLAGAAGEHGLEARARLVLSHLAIFTEGRSPLEHLEAAERAALLFEQLDDDAGLALALWHQAHMLRGTGPIDEAAAVAQRGAELASRAGDRWQEAMCRGMAAQCLAHGSTPVDSAIVRVDALLAAVGDDEPYSILGAVALLHAQAGCIAVARAFIERELAAARQAGLNLMLFNAIANAGLVERMAGNFPEAANHWRSAYELLELAHDRALLPEVAGDLACVMALGGELTEARRLAHEASTTTLPHDFRTDVLGLRAFALVDAVEGSTDEARQLSDEALARTAASDWLTFHGETLEEAATVRRLAGDDVGSGEALCEALATYEQKGNVAGAQRVRQALDETPRARRHRSNSVRLASTRGER